MSEWKKHSTQHLHVHSLRERIRKAWQILTTGQTQYVLSFSYHFADGEDLLEGTSMTVDGRSLIPLPALPAFSPATGWAWDGFAVLLNTLIEEDKARCPACNDDGWLHDTEGRVLGLCDVCTKENDDDSPNPPADLPRLPDDVGAYRLRAWRVNVNAPWEYEWVREL